MKKLFLMTMLAMLALSSQAQEKYDKDSLYKVVYASFKEDSTYKGDGGIKYLETAEQAIKNKHFANRFMADFLMQLCFDSRFGRFSDCKDYVDKFMSYCKEDSLCQKINAAYAKFYKEFSPVFPGKPAPDFTFYDTKGKIHKPGFLILCRPDPVKLHGLMEQEHAAAQLVYPLVRRGSQMPVVNENRLPEIVALP